MTLEELFAAVLHLSFYGTLGCGVILICVLINYTRAPRWISMMLWGLVALRLVLPFQFSSAISLFRFQSISELPARIENTLDRAGTDRADYQIALEGSVKYNQAVAAGSPVTITAEGNRIAYYYERENGSIEPAKNAYDIFLSIGSRIWLAGMTGLWCWAAIVYIRLKRRLRFSMRLCKGVYETDAVSSPCVVGILRPQIYLTPGLTDLQKAHILLHERMHIRYLDHIWKPASFLIISIHWFNPFLWLMYRLFQGELEKSCDERVLMRLGEDKKADYSESLLALAASKSWTPPTPIAFGENHIRGRIKQILAYRKPMITVSILIIMISVVGCGVFLTMPDGRPADEQSSSAFLSDSSEAPDEAFHTEPDSTPTTPVPDEGPSPDLTQVYSEITDNDVAYQARWDGIYRISADGSEEQLYDTFAGTQPQMLIFENRLYFATDRDYTDGALDWANNTIRWIDLENGTTGDLTLVRDNNPIAFYYINDGIVTIRYSAPDITDTLLLYIDNEIVFHGKTIPQLTEAERQQLGQEATQMVLQNPCKLINISNRLDGQNIAYLDMDGDGMSEEIILSPAQDPDDIGNRFEYDPLSYYRLQIGQNYFQTSSENLANTLWALSLDGQNILLVLYEDGPSADPYTHFYSYQQNGVIVDDGGFAADIRLCEISPDGIITGSIRQDVVQTDWITVQWQLDQNRNLTEIPQEIYDFRNGNEVTFREALPLHPAVGSSETFMLTPQTLRFLQTSADFNWVLVEAADGQQGWLHVELFEIVELHKNVMDVFDGLYMAG